MKHIGLELYYIKNGCRYMMGCNIDANPLITSENNEAWARYLRDKLSTLVTEEAMRSPEFQKIEADIAERIRHEKEWAAGAAERERKERHRKKLLSLQSDAVIIGEPVIVERTPNKEEQYQIYREKRRKEEEARRKAEEEAERNSLIPANKSLEKALFIDCRLNWECSFIGYAIDKQAKQVDALLAAGMSHDALVLFLQIVKYMCKHFVSDEHWTMYDDMYDPDYSCELIADSLNKAGKAGKLSATDISYFHKAWSEIQAMEACQSYGIADYKFDM